MPQVQELELSPAEGAVRGYARSNPGNVAVFCAIVLVQVLVLGIAAKLRIVDADEGFYLLASRLVFEHKLPYRDFLYLQTPSLPYVYGLWMKAFGMTWVAGRSLSVLLSGLAGAVLYSHVRLHSRRQLAGLFALGLYLISADVLGWFTTVKTYALSCLLLLAAYSILNRPGIRSRTALFTSGLLFGLAVDTRLYVIAAGLLFLWWLRSSPKGALWFGCGLGLALLPNAYFFAADPEAYMFGNLGYHAIRSNAGLIGKLGQKLEVLSQMPADVEFCWLLIISLVFIFLFQAKSRTAKRALALALLFFFVCLLPTPVYRQYVCIAVPFLIVAAVCASTEALANLSTPSHRQVFVAVSVLLTWICVTLSLANGQYRQYTQGIPGIALANWKWQTAAEVSHAIDKIALPGESVLSSWSGYIFSSKAAPYPGTENESALACSAVLSPAQWKKYRIISEQGIESAILGHKVRIAAVGAEMTPPGMTPSPPYAQLLRNAGYRFLNTVGGISIWEDQHDSGSEQ